MMSVHTLSETFRSGRSSLNTSSLFPHLLESSMSFSFLHFHPPFFFFFFFFFFFGSLYFLQKRCYSFNKSKRDNVGQDGFKTTSILINLWFLNSFFFSSMAALFCRRKCSIIATLLWCLFEPPFRSSHHSVWARWSPSNPRSFGSSSFFDAALLWFEEQLHFYQHQVRFCLSQIGKPLNHSLSAEK